MNKTFEMNGLLWNVVLTSPDNPILIDRTNNYTIGVTDPNSMTVYLSNQLSKDMLRKVLIHELGHCMMYSYGMLGKIHSYTKKSCWVDMEEFICNLISNYAEDIIRIADLILS